MLTSRLSSLKNLLSKNKLDAAIISSLPNIIYLTGFNHFYSGEREGFLLITKKNNYIFTDARYSHAVKTHLKNFTLLEISIQNSFTTLLEDIIKKENIIDLGIEETDITVAEQKRISSVIHQIKFLDLNTLRTTKSSEEIEKIKKACEIGDASIAYIMKQIKLGITEKEIAVLLETYMRQQGCEPSFPTIVAFGENAAVPHHKTGDKKLKKNNLILIDSGVKYHEYCSDMTRTFFFGKATPEQKKVYQTVLTSQQKAIEYIETTLLKNLTIKGSEADKASKDCIIKNGYPTFSHGLGHGVGLQVHEPPRLSPVSKDIISAGMVFSIEPGIYFPDKFGVRIEDLFTVMDNKLVQLTKSPTTLLELSI